jgi:hypothetical protein
VPDLPDLEQEHKGDDMITARELPELRQATYEHPTTPGFFAETWHSMNRETGGGTSGMDDWLHVASSSLRDGALHYVAEQFCELVAVAAPSLPAAALAPHDLPDRRGVMYFSAPLPDANLGRPVTWAAVWTETIEHPDVEESQAGLLVWWLIDRESAFDRKGLRRTAVEHGFTSEETEAWLRNGPPMVPAVVMMATFGKVLQDEPDVAEPGSALWLLRHLLATWHMQRQRLAGSHLERPDRAARRRLQRAGRTDDPAVRVIDLRAPAVSSGSGANDREYHHRWIVKGHWRQQWYPSIEDHRPVWISPHVKGPDGAPLLTGEKVYRWTPPSE